jgi:glycosyl hydrolase family 114
VDDLLEYYDWALLEDCDIWDFCGDFEPFIEEDKAVFQVEYTDEDQTIETFCPDSLNRDFSGILKNRDLDAWREVCKEH